MLDDAWKMTLEERVSGIEKRRPKCYAAETWPCQDGISFQIADKYFIELNVFKWYKIESKIVLFEYSSRFGFRYIIPFDPEMKVAVPVLIQLLLITMLRNDW